MSASGIFVFVLVMTGVFVLSALYAVHREAASGLGHENGLEAARRKQRVHRFSRAELNRQRADLQQLVVKTREERELGQQESEQVRDGLLKALCEAGSLNLKGGKGELLIRHGGALPSSTLSTYDQGRELKCELKGLGRHYDLALRVELKRASQVHLRIRHEDALTQDQRERSEDKQVGDEDFDRAFWIESRSYAGLEPLVEFSEARQAVAKVFRIPGVNTLTVMRGRLRIDGEIDAEVPRESLIGLLGGMRLLARIYEGDPPVTLKLAARAVEVETAARCPYCRDELVGQADVSVITCEGCGTPQHFECNEENGGCPVLGCGAAVARRALAT